jgi:hypothetical protein
MSNAPEDVLKDQREAGTVLAYHSKLSKFFKYLYVNAGKDIGPERPGKPPHPVILPATEDIFTADFKALVSQVSPGEKAFDANFLSHTKEFIQDQTPILRKFELLCPEQPLKNSPLLIFWSTLRTEDDKLFSKSTYGNHRSAIVYFYEQYGVSIPDELAVLLPGFSKGVGKRVTKAKKNGDLPQYVLFSFNFGTILVLYCYFLFRLRTGSALYWSLVRLNRTNF